MQKKVRKPPLLEVTVREYLNRDWPIILQMMTDTMVYHMSIQQPARFHSYTLKLLRDYLRELTAKQRVGSGKFLVAVNSEDVPVGFVYGEVDKQGPELARNAVKSGTVYEIYVSPEVRHQKVAQKLMSEIERYCRQNKCVLIRLHDVHHTNLPAKNLYAQLGYAPRVIEFAKVLGTQC